MSDFTEGFDMLALNPAVASSPGRIGLTHIHGDVGKMVEFGQYLNGNGFTAWEHAFMDLGDGTLIEAEPGGARIRALTEYDPRDVYWCDRIYGTVSYSQKIAAGFYGKTLEGTPYSFLDYYALATHRLHIPAPGLRSYLASSKHMICSQLVTHAYKLAGVDLFPYLWTGYVTPGMLYQLDIGQRATIQ